MTVNLMLCIIDIYICDITFQGESFLLHVLQPVNASSEIMPLTVTYSPISVGKLRMWTSFLESFKMLHSLGLLLINPTSCVNVEHTNDVLH